MLVQAHVFIKEFHEGFQQMLVRTPPVLPCGCILYWAILTGAAVRDPHEGSESPRPHEGALGDTVEYSFGPRAVPLPSTELLAVGTDSQRGIVHGSSSTGRHSSAPQHRHCDDSCAVLCCAVLCCAVLCCAVLCCAVLGTPVL